MPPEQGVKKLVKQEASDCQVKADIQDVSPSQATKEGIYQQGQ